MTKTETKENVWRQICHALSYFRYMKGAQGRYLLGITLSALEYALAFATPYVNEALIAIVSGEREGSVMRMLLLMLVLFLLLAPLIVIGNFYKDSAAAHGTANLRKELFSHMVRLPQETAARYRTGDFLTLINEDAENACSLFHSFGLVQGVRFLAVFPVALVLLLKNDPRIAAAGVLYGCVNLAFSLYLNPRAKSLDGEARKEVAGSSSFVVDTLKAMTAVRVFLMQSKLAERYRAHCESIKTKQMHYQSVIGVTYGTVDFFAQSAQVVGFLLGILLGGSSLSETVFNATLMGMMGDAVYRLSTFLLLLQPKLAAIYRVEGLLHEPTEEPGEISNFVDFSSNPAVQFSNVSFSYDGRKSAVNSLNLTLHTGEHLAIVGGSGGGKSTVMKLMEQFFTADSGEIRYFGKSGGELTTEQVRDLFAYVPQECTLFDGTVAENIAMGKKNATPAEVENAARKAGIHSFIAGLPQGYQTPVGEFGGQLSGGQRQRIAIARAVLKDAPILLFDEATAALDSATEQELMRCIEEISAGKTIVTVAHRLSTVKNADRILVMEHGAIAESGTFHGLLAAHGRFYQLWQKQEESVRFR